MNECDQLPEHIRPICRGEDPRVPLHDVNLNRANGFGGLIPPLPPLPALTAPPAPEPPPVLIRGWNFAKALARWTLAGMPRRSKREISERLAICQACEYLQNEHCTKCGCGCVEQNQVLNKLTLATEVCPEGKWT